MGGPSESNMKVWTGLTFLLAFAATTGDNNRRRGMELQNKQNVNNRNYSHSFITFCHLFTLYSFEYKIIMS